MADKIQVMIESSERYPDFSIRAFKPGTVIAPRDKVILLSPQQYHAYLTVQESYNRMQKKLEEWCELPSENKT